jgi:hypothetical protein
MKVRETIHVAASGIEPGLNGAEYETVGRTDDTVYRSTVTMKVGIATSGKTWRRLIPEEMQCFSWRRGGRMRFYDARWTHTEGRGKRYRQFVDRTTNLVQGYTRPTPRLQEALLEHTSKASLSQVIRSEYPLAVDLPAGRGMTQLLAQPSIQDYTRAFYGSKYYRKDLVRGVANRGWLAVGGNQYLMMTKGFAPLIPTDWIAKGLLDLEEPVFHTLASGATDVRHDYRDYRRLLRTASPKQVRMLWRDSAARAAESWAITDTFRSWDQIRGFDPTYRLDGIVFSDWKTLHDVLAEDRRRIRERNVVIEHSEEWKSLEGQYGEYTVLLPKDTHELISWGGQMANCIGGYTYDAIRNSTYLYAVLKGGKMICNMEIMPDRPKGGTPELRQMVGKHNSTLSKEDHDAIYAIVNAQFPQRADNYYIGQTAGGERLADWERELLQPVRGEF